MNNIFYRCAVLNKSYFIELPRRVHSHPSSSEVAVTRSSRRLLRPQRYRIAQFLLLALIAALGLLATQPAKAADLYFFSDLSNSFDEQFNWTNCPPNLIVPTCTPGAPGSSDNAFFYSGVWSSSDYTVDFQSSTTSNLRAVVGGNTVTWDLDGSAYNLTTTSSSLQSLTVGVESPYDGGTSTSSFLTLLDGTINTEHVSIGHEVGYTGRIVVGQDATITATLNMANRLKLGNQANGTLTILPGSTVDAHNARLGNASGVTGTLLVNGSGASFNTTAGNLNLGYASGSTGTVNILPGGTVSTTGSLNVGGTASQNGGAGQLTVLGSSLLVGNDLNIWDAGTATLQTGNIDITDELIVHSGGTLSHSNGTINTDTLTIEDGGTVVSLSGSLRIGSASINNSINTVGSVFVSGSGAFLDVLQSIIIGEDSGSTVNLDVSTGASVTALSLILGNNSGANGTLDVDGSAIINIDNNTEVAIDSSSTGTINLSNSSTLNTGNLYVGGDSVGSGGTGVVNVRSNSLLDVASEMTVWDGGIVTLESGGTLSTNNTILGVIAGEVSTINVDGSGSQWTDEGTLVIGQSGTGIINLKGGGNLTTNASIVGQLPGSTGMVNVGDGLLNSTWSVSNGGNIFVGQSGTGTINVKNGSMLSGSGNIVVLSGGTINVEEGGLLGDGSTNLIISDSVLTIDSMVASVHLDQLQVSSNATVTVMGGNGFLIGTGNGIQFDDGWSYKAKTATISNSGSSLEINGVLDIATRESGPTLTIGAGGSVSATLINLGSKGNLNFPDPCQISPCPPQLGFYTGESELLITGNGSLLSTTGAMTIGEIDTSPGSLLDPRTDLDGILTIEAGATVNADGGITVNGGDGGGGSVINMSGGVITTTNFVLANAPGNLEGNTGNEVAGKLNFTGGIITVSGGSFSDVASTNLVLDGNNPTLQLDNTAHVGNPTSILLGQTNTGTLQLANGSTASSSSSVEVGATAGGTGTLIISDTGSELSTNNVNINRGNVTVTSNGALSASGSVIIASTGNLLLDGGSITAGSLSAVPGNFDFDGGTLTITSGTFSNGDNSLIIEALNVSDPATLNLYGGSANYNDQVYIGKNNKGIINITGLGSLSNEDGHIGYSSGSTGTVNLTGNNATWTNNNSLFVGRSGTATLTLSNGANVLSDTAFVASKSGSIANINVDGNNSAWINSGNMWLGGDDLGGGGSAVLTVSNNGLVSTLGTFTVCGTSTLGINNGGNVNVANTLAIFDNGQVNLADGTLTATNVTNTGTVTVSSDSSIVSHFSNTNSGRLEVANSATLTINGDVIHNGEAIDVGTGSTLKYEGTVTGASDFTGDGNHIFQGSFNPGNSAGLVNIAGNVEFDSSHTLIMELAGLTPGSEYDVLSIDGTAMLGGFLDVDLLSSFMPSLGDSFDLLTATTLFGTFDSLLLPELVGLQWELQYLLDPSGLDTLRLSAVSAVPIPAAVWLFGSGLIGMVAVGRRRREMTPGFAREHQEITGTFILFRTKALLPSIYPHGPEPV